MKANNSSLRQLIEGTKVFAVPLYQRRYSWERENWEAFWRSVLEQYDYSLTDPDSAIPVTHFLGSIVLAPAPGPASSPTRYVLVDGQQRLTTTMVALSALRDLLAAGAEDETARAAYIAKYNTLYLHNSFEVDPGKRLRLLPTQQDRSDFEASVGRTPASPKGRLGDAYDYFRSTKAMGGVDLQGDPLDLERVAEVLLGRLMVVEITTEAGDNVHRIFQTLNSAGVKLKQVDLLRNHFFMLLPTRGESLYGEVWREMELRLGESLLDRFFWADLVRSDARVSRTDVYAAMQRRLEPIAHDEPAVERELRRFHEDSFDYVAIIRSDEAVPPEVETRLEFLRRWGTETAQPLLLELLSRMRRGEISVQDVVASLNVIESFVVRRMLASIPTNNLNRIFSSLTPSLARRPRFGPTDIATSLAEGQKYWPSDDLVRESVAARPFYLSGRPHQRRMILDRIARAFDGKEPVESGSNLTIEHILPQEADGGWLGELSPDPFVARQLHSRLINTLGNLTLTGYNPELGARSYAVKRGWYRESALRMNRDLADRYDTWNAEAIEARGKEMAEVIIREWPGPVASAIDLGKIEESTIEDAILLMPAGSWTSRAEIEALAGPGGLELDAILARMPVDLAARVVTDDANLDPRRKVTAEQLADALGEYNGGAE